MIEAIRPQELIVREWVYAVGRVLPLSNSGVISQPDEIQMDDMVRRYEVAVMDKDDLKR